MCVCVCEHVCVHVNCERERKIIYMDWMERVREGGLSKQEYVQHSTANKSVCVTFIDTFLLSTQETGSLA